MRGPTWGETAGPRPCLTVLARRREAEVRAALAVDPASRRDATFAEGEEAWTDDHTPVQIWTDGDRVIVVEPNGYLGSLPDVLRRMTGPGDGVAVFWNVNAEMKVVVVRAGAVVRELDPLLGDGEHDPLPEEAGLPFGDEQPGAASLALLERLTGFAATHEAILGPRRPTYTARTRALLG
ncbi:MAG: hypothetical protein EOO75_15075 [Myxococcales bacterium]|nr:MAG: hypothetical protein EOO75_15075 [Myxococcales bacterium]